MLKLSYQQDNKTPNSNFVLNQCFIYLFICHELNEKEIDKTVKHNALIKNQSQKVSLQKQKKKEENIN